MLPPHHRDQFCFSTNEQIRSFRSLNDVLAFSAVALFGGELASQRINHVPVCVWSYFWKWQVFCVGEDRVEQNFALSERTKIVTGTSVGEQIRAESKEEFFLPLKEQIVQKRKLLRVCVFIYSFVYIRVRGWGVCKSDF